MKSKLIVLSVVVLVFCVSQVFAEGGHDHGSHDDVVNEEIISSEAVNIGNKICPISGEVIADVDDGKGDQVEHEGRPLDPRGPEDGTATSVSARPDL